MSKIIRSIRYDVAEKVTLGNNFDFTDNILILGPSGWNGSGDVASLVLGDTTNYITATNPSSITIGTGGLDRITVGTTINMSVDTSIHGKLTTSTFQLTTGATNNYVLTSDASGNATWQPSGGSTSIIIQDADNDTKVEVEQTADEDIIHLTTAGTERMTIGSTGNIGIGIINASELLHIRDDTALASTLMISNYDSTNGNYRELKFTGYRDINTVHPSASIRAVQVASDTGLSKNSDLSFWTENGNNGTYGVEDITFTEKMRVTSSGNVGIGITNPSQKLDVNGDGLIQGGDLYLVDTNEKIASDGTDMFFHVGGSEVVRFEAGGNVGIGTNNPSQTLHVVGTGYITDNLLFDSASVVGTNTTDGSDNGYIVLSGGGADGAGRGARIVLSGNERTTFGGGLELFSGLGPDDTIKFNTNSDTERMRITSAGLIGMGTNNPSQTLDVNGDTLIRGGDLYLVDTDEKVASNGTDMFFHVGGSEVVRFEAGGNVGVGTNNPDSKLDVYGSETTSDGQDASVSIKNVATNGGSWWLRAGADGTQTPSGGFTIADTTAYRFTIDSSGNVGIATTIPSQTLDVNGDVLVQGGDLYLVDTDEKIASDGTNIFFHVGGSEVVRFKAGGNVGIGSNDPTQTLDVNGDVLVQGGDLYLVDTNNKISSDASTVTIDANGSTRFTLGSIATINVDTVIQGNLTVNGDTTTINSQNIEIEDTLISLGTTNTLYDTLDIGFYGTYNSGGVRYAGLIRDASDSGTWHLFDGTVQPGTTTTFSSRANLHANNLELDSALGIGTNNPTQTLHVVGTGYITDNLLFDNASVIGTNTTDGSDNAYIVLSGGGADGSGRGGRIVLSGNERTTFGGSVEIAAGAGVDGTIKFRTNSDTERMRITSAGLIGIGVTNPSQTLDVNGDTLIQGGDLYLVDTNEKIASNGTDMFFHVGGSEVVRFKAGGNVGIGTNDPTNTLEVQNNSFVQTVFSSSASSGGIQLKNNTPHVWEIQSVVTSNDFLIYDRTQEATRLLIDTSGNVGIGTINPNYLMHLTSSATNGYSLWSENPTQSTSTTFSMFHGTNSSSLNGVYQQWNYIGNGSTSNYMSWDFNGQTNVLVLKADGAVTMGTNGATTGKLTVAGQSDALHIAKNADINTDETRFYMGGFLDNQIKSAIITVPTGTFGRADLYFCLNAVDDVSNVTSDDYRMVIRNTGNVGIGVTSPSQTLDVNGDVLVQGGDLYLVDTNEKIASDGTNIFFHVGGSEVVRFEAGGNVGIGTNDPSQTLDINGDVIVQGGDLYLVDTNEKIASDGTDMSMHVGGLERMVITGISGYVGIGTDVPSKLLDVYGSNANMVIRSTTEDEDSYLYFSTPFNTSAPAKSAIIAEGASTFSRSNLHFCLNNTGDNTTEVSLSDAKMTILRDGKVGIGTNNPSYLLHLTSSATNGFSMWSENPTQSTSTTFGMFHGTNSSSLNGVYQQWNYIGNGSTSNYMSWDFNGQNNVLVLKATGHIGIRTTSINSDLHIKQSSDAGSTGGITMERLNTTDEWRFFVEAGGSNIQYRLNGSNLGFIATGGSNTAFNFTGQHRSYSNNLELGITSYGLIVSSIGKYRNINIGITNPPTINDALPIVDLSTNFQDKTVFGVISDKEDDNSERVYQIGIWATNIDKIEGDERLFINSLGEGGVWVSNKDGSFDNGDYITTCTIPGYGTLQSDDLLHNYTVAKITQDEDFSDMTLGVTMKGVYYECARYLDAVGNILTEAEYDVLIGITNEAFKAKFVGCTYHCG